MWSSLNTVSHVVCFYSSFIFASWKNSGQHVKLLVFCAQSQPLLTCKYVTQLPTPWKKRLLFRKHSIKPRSYASGSDFLCGHGINKAFLNIFITQDLVPNSYSPLHGTMILNICTMANNPMLLHGGWFSMKLWLFRVRWNFSNTRLLALHQSSVCCRHVLNDVVCKDGLLASKRQVITSTEPLTSFCIDFDLIFWKGLTLFV